MELIATEQIVAESPDPDSIYLYTPAIARGFDGRLVVAIDYGGPGTDMLDGPRSPDGDYRTGNQIRFLLSDDHGATWRSTDARVPMRHEIIFQADGKLYMIGNDRRLCISRSDDNGETWSTPAILDEKHTWHQSAVNVEYSGGRVYLVEECYNGNRWPGASQVLMSASVQSDLTLRSNWSFSEPFNGDALTDSFRALLDLPSGTNTGILETNVLPLLPTCGHLYRPGHKDWLLAARVHTEGLDYGALLRGTVNADGVPVIETFPSRTTGLPFFLVPLQGGFCKFHAFYDTPSQRYYLLASEGRQALARNSHETFTRSNRRSLGLWSSPDFMCWRHLGTVAYGPSENGARHYAQMVPDGDNLVIASRSGDSRAKSAHDNNLTTIHIVPNFRTM